MRRPTSDRDRPTNKPDGAEGESSAPARKPGRRAADLFKRAVNALLAVLFPKSRDQPLPSAEEVRRVLLVRVNYRMGNTVLVTALLPILRARFPHAVVDVLVGDTAAAVFEGLDFECIHQLSRRDLRRPWRLLGLIRRLRRRRYEVAIDGGLTSFSGALYGFLGGARWRIGGRGRNDRFLNVRLALPKCETLYDEPATVARALGVAVAGWPACRVAADEAAAAAVRLGQMDALPGKDFLGVFVGGHGHKRWPRENWMALLEQLEVLRVPALVFVGPEEREFVGVLTSRDWTFLHIVPPGPLRAFAALVSRASLLLTPDSGPMHLAAALRVPVLALLTTAQSRFYVPAGGENAAIVLAITDPAADQAAAVSAALHGHPAWTRVARPA